MGLSTNHANAIWPALLVTRSATRHAPLDRSMSVIVDGGSGGLRVAWGQSPGQADVLNIHPDGDWTQAGDDTDGLCQLFLPLIFAAAGRTSYAVAHLGQSLDGRIATEGGESRWLTGDQDLDLTHRLRSLADAVVVGAGTIQADDPQLTVRRCAGDSPVRVVLDPNRRLSPDYQIFSRPGPPTLLVTAADRTCPGERHGLADVVGVVVRDGQLRSADVLALLASRGLAFVFIEGGGVTVSRFLAERALDRLMVSVAPVIIGSGRPVLVLPPIGSLAGALRPKTRIFPLGADVLFDCVLC